MSRHAEVFPSGSLCLWELMLGQEVDLAFKFSELLKRIGRFLKKYIFTVAFIAFFTSCYQPSKFSLLS